LTWGDGYVDKVIEDRQMGDLSADPTVSKNQIVSSSGYNKCYQFCPVEAALMRMSSHLYPLGEGIIGRVALTGQHCWISANELCSRYMHKYREDWQLQVAAGIKTVLLVPVVPHGVLQLGSLDMVFESAGLVALIKDLFHELYDVPVSHTSLSVGSAYSNSLRPPTGTLSIDHPDVNLSEIDCSAQFLNDHLNLTHPFSTSECPILEDITIGSYGTSPTGRPNGPLDGNGTMEYEYFNDFTLTDMAHGYQENTCGDGGTVPNDGVVISNSSIHSEFHRDLTTMSREEHELVMWHSRLKHTSPASLQLNHNNADFYMQLETNNYEEMLPDTIIDQIGHTSNSESSHSTDSPFSCETKIKKDHALRLDEPSVPNIPGGQELSPIPMNEGFISCAMADASPTEINKTITEACIIRNTQGINSVEIKKRGREVELQRPRPRDRQLIQDRMKGLRELIPNASKCSIDALLDKTIAYMLFLQSVSEKAEKIQNTLENKEPRNGMKKQLESCPLRVEELDQPGYLLIEMLCESNEVFLEMAHVLKGLEVSILKGVLEHRSDKLWARFIIEVDQRPVFFGFQPIL
ncbi:Transcription factor LHW, partial [Dichanthelium oligosanthes]